MTQTEAEKRACMKYQAKLKAFTIRLKPDEMARYKAAADKQGLSFRSFVITAMDKATDSPIRENK